jgi:FO synthase
VKIGLPGVAQMMRAGCSDLGGTLINENISRAAGASHGQEMTAAGFSDFAASLGRPAEQRTTNYGRVEASSTAVDRG